ncbi:MAG TPA: sensor domain-containing diguanylate cyclase [Clostridia bacterium]|nr:sensor domain-containing diguanylate cyclase [Clostridia bacterium]
MNQSILSNDKLLEIIAMQTEVVQQGIDLGAIMNLVTARAQRITNASGASVELIEKSELVYSSVAGIAEKFLGLRLDVGNSLSGLCINARTPLISNDIEIDARVNKNACRKIGIKSMIVMPLICRDDVVGVLKVFSPEVNHFDENTVEVLRLISGAIAAAMSSAIKNGESELFYKATHDSLTGIPNRSLFYDRLRQKLSEAARENGRFGVVSMDLDGLKEINDTYGHYAGDAAIKEVALRAASAVRKADLVARLGGDEYGILAATATSRSGLHTLEKRVYSALEKPFEFQGHLLPLKVSIGYALYNEDGEELESLLDKADQAMYEVKRAHKGAKNVR